MPTLRTQLVLDDMKHLKDEFVMLVYTAATIVCTSLTGCWSLDVARWDNLSVSIAEGDTVTLTCRSPTPERRTRGSLGLVQGEDRGVGMVPLWDSGLQGEAVNRRYRITYRVSGPKSVLRLTIRDAKEEDSGSYGCLLNSDERTASYMTLNVLEGGLGRGTRIRPSRTRPRRDYDYVYTYGESDGLDVDADENSWWLTVVLPVVIVVGLVLLVIVCILDRCHKKQCTTHRASSMSYPASSARRRPRRATGSNASSTQQQQLLRNSQQRQDQRRSIHPRARATIAARQTHLTVDSSSGISPASRGATCGDGPPPYEEAVDTSVYPSVQRSEPTSYSERDESPPAYSTLGSPTLDVVTIVLPRCNPDDVAMT